MMTRALAVLALAFVSHSAAAQDACPTKLEKPNAQEAPSFELRRLSKATVVELRSQLRAKQWANAIKVYATQYQPQLPDWVVYIDELGNVSQCVIADNHAGPVVRGKKFIWAMVFSERPMVVRDSALNKVLAGIVNSAADSAKKLNTIAAVGQLTTATRSMATILTDSDTLDLRLSRRNVVFPRDPVLLTIVKALAKGFSFDPAATPTPTLIDSVRTIDLRQVSNDTTDSIWVGFGRIGLAEGALTELSLAPAPGKAFPSSASGAPLPLERIYTHIVDVKQHTFEIGLLAAWNWESNAPTYDANARSTGAADVDDFGAYATLFANLPWRMAWLRAPYSGNPLQHRSIGGFIGTNVLTGSLGDQLILGASIGHIWGDAGLSFGRASVPAKVLRGSSLIDGHRWRWLLGIDLRM